MAKITASRRCAGVKRSSARGLMILCTLVLARLTLGGAIAANLDLQEKCANRARNFLIELREDGKATHSGRNHYSEQFEKCFIWIGRYTSIASKIDWRESLLDAFEGASFGKFMFINDLTKKNKQPPPPMACYADLPEGTKYCKTYEEFVKLIAVYLNMP